MPTFKVSFREEDYVDIWPDPPSDEREIINNDKDIEDAIWTRQEPKGGILTMDFLDLEMKRLRQGAYIWIKDVLLWIPPNYYQFLQYGIAGGSPPEFRLKKLKHKYFKIKIRNNPQAIGTDTIKGRQDGETTDVMSDALWELGDGVNYHGQIGMQSKTNEDAYNPCWISVKAQWNNYPEWLKKAFYSDIVNPKNMETQIRFERPATPEKNGSPEKLARNLYMRYYASKHDAMDGKTNVLRSILDEKNKWRLTSFYDTYLNQKKFILNGAERRGMFDMFSSPADVNGRWNDEAYAFWKLSDPNKLNEVGTTETRVFRYHLDPLEGIQGMYDKYGDADANKIYEHIMRERRSVPDHKKLGEVRGYPLNEEEMFGSYEANTIWQNHKGIVTRKLYVMTRTYKDETTLEPKGVYGNLEWPEGIRDIAGEPVFRPNKINVPDPLYGRWFFSHLPEPSMELKDIKKPPTYCGSCLGVDPFNLRHDAKNKKTQSNGGGVVYKFKDFGNIDYIPKPIGEYLARPHQDIFFEDMIMGAIFTRSMVQYESRSDKLANWFEDRGYFDWLLPEKGQDAKSVRKGDSPDGSGAFLNEGIFLINANTNVPIDKNKPYLLEHIWLERLLTQIEEFDANDTQKSDLVMAYIQALYGAAKMSNLKVRRGERINNQMLRYLLG